MSTPERVNRAGDQVLPQPGEGDVLDELARNVGPALLERRRIGIARYGQPLQAFNGRDVGRDLEEEILDALAYARQARIERAHLEAAVVTLRARVAELEAMLLAP